MVISEVGVIVLNEGSNNNNNKQLIKDNDDIINSINLNQLRESSNNNKYSIPPPRPPRPSITANSNFFTPPQPPPTRPFRSSPPIASSLPYMSSPSPSSTTQSNYTISTRSKLTTTPPIRPERPSRKESISLEDRILNFDRDEIFDLELGLVVDGIDGTSERKEGKISKKAQSLLGLDVDVDRSGGNMKRGGPSGFDGLEDKEELGRSRRREDERVLRVIDSIGGGGGGGSKYPTPNSINNTPSTPPELPFKKNSISIPPTNSNNNRSQFSTFNTPPSTSNSNSRSSNQFNSSKSPSSNYYNPIISRSSSTFSTTSSNLSPSPFISTFNDQINISTRMKDKRISTSNSSTSNFMGFSNGFKNLGRKKSSASYSNTSSSIIGKSISMSRSSSHSSFGETGALGELEEEEDEEEEEEVELDRDSERIDGMVVGKENNEDFEELYNDNDKEEEEEEEDFIFNDENFQIKVGSKAANLLGLGLLVGERIGSPESSSMNRSNSKVTSSIGSITGGNERSTSSNGEFESEENFPIFSCQKMDLDPYQLISNQINRQSTHPTSFLRQKEWRSRFIVLSSFQPSNHSSITLASLHCFKSNGELEKEIDRLDLTSNSLVYLPEEQYSGNKLNVLKVTGLSPKEKDELGNIKKGIVRKEEIWLLALDNITMLKNWMIELKGVVHDLGGLSNSTTTSLMDRSHSRSSNFSVGGGRRESNDNLVDSNLNVRSTTSMSMNSINSTNNNNNRIQNSASPLGFLDSSSHAYYKPNANYLNSIRSISSIQSNRNPIPTELLVTPPTRPLRPIRLPKSINQDQELPIVEIIEDSESELPYHPYRRPSLTPSNFSNNELKSNSKLIKSNSSSSTIPSNSSTTRRSLTEPLLIQGIVGPISPTSTTHSRSSHLSNTSSSTNNSSTKHQTFIPLPPRAPPPTGALPDTPPSNTVSFQDKNHTSSISSVKNSGSSNFTSNIMETNGNSLTSVNSSNGSNSRSKFSPGGPPPPPPPPMMPPPTSSLPPIPNQNDPTPSILNKSTREMKESSSNHSIKTNSILPSPPRRREFVPNPLPPPTTLLPLPPPPPPQIKSSSFNSTHKVTMSNSRLPPPTSALPPPPFLIPGPPPTTSLPPLPLPLFQSVTLLKPPPKSLNRKPSVKRKGN